MRKIFIFTCAMLTTSCSLFNEKISRMDIPSTVGEWVAGASYIPIDPLPASCQGNDVNLLKSLPDHVVRLAIGEYNEKGEISYGPGQIGRENKIYKVILDYVNTGTTSVDFQIFRFNPEDRSLLDPRSDPKPGTYLVAELVDSTQDEAPSLLAILSSRSPDNGVRIDRNQGKPVAIPVYVGIGLRLTATVRVLKGNVSLGSLGALAQSAQAGQISGSLVIQTLGISGSPVIAALPLPNQIDQPTIQDAILKIGSIKTLLSEDNSNIILKPRTTGFFNPYAGSGPELISSIISELARSPVFLKWC